MQPLTPERGAAAVDVLVAGGGVAGVAAAVAAARAGSSVLLAERGGELGGIGTRGMLRTICGLYLNGGTEPRETLNRGLAQEIESRLRAHGPRRAVEKVGKVYVLRYSSAGLVQALESLCRQEAGITVRLHTPVVSLAVDAGRVIGAELGGAETRIMTTCRAMVDCTGSGEAAALAGAEFDLSPPDQVQLAGYTVRLTGLAGQDEALRLKVPYVLAEAAKSGRLLPETRYTSFGPGDEPGEGYLKFSVDSAGRGTSETQARAEAERAVCILSERIPSFRDASIISASQGVLEREGRRVRGEYELTGQDVLTARKFDDAAARNSWPIELWSRKKGPVFQYVPAGEYYEIPFRCLTVRGFSNLLTAGRCISVSHEALGSTRVMGACMALGDAAGRAAAVLAMTGEYPSFRAERS